MNYLEYLKIPYKFRGSGIGEGADCYRLVKLIYSKEFGIDLPDADYVEDWFNLKDNLILARYESEGFFKIPDSPRKGDVVVLIEHRIPKHLGVIIDSEYFIHTTKIGTAVHSYKSGQWYGKIHCILRHKDNQNDN